MIAVPKVRPEDPAEAQEWDFFIEARAARDGLAELDGQLSVVHVDWRMKVDDLIAHRAKLQAVEILLPLAQRALADAEISYFEFRKKSKRVSIDSGDGRAEHEAAIAGRRRRIAELQAALKDPGAASRGQKYQWEWEAIELENSVRRLTMEFNGVGQFEIERQSALDAARLLHAQIEVMWGNSSYPQWRLPGMKEELAGIVDLHRITPAELSGEVVEEAESVSTEQEVDASDEKGGIEAL
jgi:hypothetical protein